ncbi:MAG: hypothetical protein JXR30_00575 [Alphaproteobacteria bacterium]|nr:hypothetical protein [Alphaproteobacteria bacterium]
MTKKESMDRTAVFSIIDGGLSQSQPSSRIKTQFLKTRYPEAHYRENLKKLAYAFQDFQSTNGFSN